MAQVITVKQNAVRFEHEVAITRLHVRRVIGAMLILTLPVANWACDVMGRNV